MRIPILPSDLAAYDSADESDVSTLSDTPTPDPDQVHQYHWLDKSDALAQTGSALAQMPAEVNARLEDAKQQAGPGAAGFTGLALDNFDKYHQQISDTLPPEARPAFTLAAKPYRDFIGQGALQYEAQQRLDWRAGQFTQSTDLWADQVARSPALLPLASTILRETQPLLEPEQNTLLSQYVHGKLLQSGVAGALAEDAPGLLKTLGGSTDMPGTNDPDAQAQPGAIDLDHPLVKLMTPAEQAHYREVARITVLQQQATQREALKTRTADATQSYLDTGTAKNPPMLSDMVNAFGQEEGSTRYRDMQDAAMLGQTKQRILPLPQGELARLRGQVPAEDDLQGQRSYQALTGAIDSIEKERRADPMGFALKNNSYGLSPIKDFNDTAAVAAELGRRQRASSTLRSDYGTEPTVLSKEENQLLLQTMKALPPDGQGKMLQQFAQGLNDPALMDSAMRVLSAQAPVQALAGLAIAKDYAGSEDEAMGHLPLGGSGRISAGQTMLEGEAARNPSADKPDAKPLPMPPDGQTRQSYASLVGDRFADQPGAEEAHYQAALAAYAGLSRRAGDASGEFDAQRWSAAVKLATEGSGTARELGLVLAFVNDDERLRHRQYTFASAENVHSDVGRQLLAGSDTETGAAAGDSVQVALGNAPGPAIRKVQQQETKSGEHEVLLPAEQAQYETMHPRYKGLTKPVGEVAAKVDALFDNYKNGKPVSESDFKDALHDVLRELQNTEKRKDYLAEPEALALIGRAQRLAAITTRNEIPLSGEEAAELVKISLMGPAGDEGAPGFGTKGLISGAKLRVPPPSAATAVTVEGTFYRYSPPDKVATAWDAHPGNVKATHRYSPEGTGAVYGASSEKTARAEIEHYGDLDNRVLTSKKIKVDQVLDLTDKKIQQQLGIDERQIANERYAIPHEIAERAKELGYKGIKAPSARDRNGWNLVIFN